MDFNNQINELVDNVNTLEKDIDSSKNKAATIKIEINRLRKIHKSLSANDITYDDNNGDKKINLSDFINAIIDDKENDIAALKDTIDTYTNSIKKYKKAIDTLANLAGINVDYLFRRPVIVSNTPVDVISDIHAATPMEKCYA